MAVDKLVDSSELDYNLSYLANVIRSKAGLSTALLFPNGFINAVQNIPVNEGNAVMGTFIPMSHLRSITLPDCVEKENIIIFPMFDLETSTASLRVHWGAVILQRRVILQGSTNSTKTEYIMKSTMLAGTGYISGQDEYSPENGTVTIVSGAYGNYGGYFAADHEYGYVAW